MKSMNPIDAYNAVNKFLFYCWNFDVQATIVDIETGEYEYLPTFLSEIYFDCPLQHMVEKWHHACHIEGEAVINFYKMLDFENRKKLVEWIASNYNNEPGKAE